MERSKSTITDNDNSGTVGDGESAVLGGAVGLVVVDFRVEVCVGVDVEVWVGVGVGVGDGVEASVLTTETVPPPPFAMLVTYAYMPSGEIAKPRGSPKMAKFVVIVFVAVLITEIKPLEP